MAFCRHDGAGHPVIASVGGLARRVRVAGAGAAAQAGTGRIKTAGHRTIWPRRGSIVHRCQVQIDLNTLPEDPATLQ